MHKYSCEEIDELGAYMKPERDDNFGYAATTTARQIFGTTSR
jgi:ribonucleoside-diphosphate reductase alpha chain